MATVESGTTGAKEHQENMPSGEGTVLNETPTLQDFSELTPSHFGISVQSFTQSSSSNLKDKSRLAQIKARRRSSVGVRGSPETNSLIRFIAQQRMKTPLTPQTPELVRSSPFFPRVASTLRQKMASFQNLMDVVESDACDPMPVQDSNTGGCIMTRDYLSDGISCGKGKENSPPTAPTPCKKRCLGPSEGCSVEIREAQSFIPHSSLKEHEGAVCEHQSPSQSTSTDTAAALPPQHSPTLHIQSLPSLNEMKPTGEAESTRTSKVNKKKQVHFGGPLSPEFFDKNLPPITPLRKGGTPARPSTPGGSLQLRSVLKTPQRSESKTPQDQPEPHSPTEFGASPTLPRRHKVFTEGDDSEDGKMVFSAVEVIDFDVTSDTEFVLDVQPLNLNSAFHEETLPEALTECETRSRQTSQMDVTHESKSDEKEPEAVAESLTPTRSSKRNKKTAQEPKTQLQARSSKRKRKLAEESEPVKRSSRSAAKSACRKMKEASSAARCWNKDVDRSLYGSREYASKNPSLSPIRERLSFISQSPASQQTPESCTDPNQETLIVLEMANDNQKTNDPAVTKVVEKTSKDSRSSPSSDKENNRKVSRSVGKRRGQRKSRVSVTDSEEQTGEKTEQHFEDQSSSDLKFSGETPSKPRESHQFNVETEELGVQFSVDTPCTDRETPEYHESLDASTRYCPPSSDESSNSEPEQKKAKWGRRSSALQEPLKYAEKHQSSCDVDENGLRDQADRQHKNIQSSSDSQEEGGGADEDLAPWQADFNFEDVFEPAARRGQRSVRRSLRNQCIPEHRGTSAGLAWLPRTSPDSVKESRRKSRQRRLSAALPAQPPLPEETQDASLNELRLKGAN